MHTRNIQKFQSDLNSNKQAVCVMYEYAYCTDAILITVAMNVSPLFIVPGI